MGWWGVGWVCELEGGFWLGGGGEGVEGFLWT